MTVEFVLSLIFCVMSSAVLLYALWICAVSVIGSMAREKKYPPAPPCNIAVMICARNEEKVIGQLIDSLKRQNYPSENYKIFVVAHNCIDSTAEVAFSHGAQVFVRNAPGENRKAPALQYGLDSVRAQYGDFFSHFVVFDADCLVNRDFLKEINSGLATGADVASGYYSSKNFGDSIVSSLSGTLYICLMRMTCIPHGNLNLPVNVYGSGYAAKMSCGLNLNEIDTMVDDFEFSTRLVMQKAKLISVPSAIFYAEMPVTLRDALIQRRRWSMGDTQCYRKYRRELRRSLPRLGWSGVKQYMDLIMNPVSVTTVFGLMLGLILLIMRGVLREALVYIFAAALLFYSLFFIGSANTLRKDGRKISENITVCLIMPFWVFLSVVLAADTFFIRDLDWIPTKHVSAKDIDDMEGAKNK